MTQKGSANLLHLRSFTIMCDFILMQTKITKCTQEKVERMAVKFEVSVNTIRKWVESHCHKYISCLRVALQNGHWCHLMKKKGYEILIKFIFTGNLCWKHFLSTSVVLGAHFVIFLCTWYKCSLHVQFRSN